MKNKTLYTAILLAASMAYGADGNTSSVADPTLATSATAAGAEPVQTQTPQALEDVPVTQQGDAASDTPWPRGVFVDVTVGTQGIGMDVGYSINKYFKVRVRGTYIPKYDRTDEWDSVSVDSSLESSSCGLILDYHPWGESFRLSVGLNAAPLKVEADGSVNGEKIPGSFQNKSYNLGNYDYRIKGDTITGHLRGKYEWETVQPYIGIGWSCSSKSKHRWFFTADIGVNIMGKGDLSVSGDTDCIEQKPVNLPDVPSNWSKLDLGNLESNLREEGKDVFEIADKIVVYPVLHFGVGCRF